MSRQSFGFGDVLSFARQAKLNAAAQGFAAMAGLARLAASESASVNRRNALADFGWDASSLIECRISMAANKGFFGRSFVEASDPQPASHRSAQ